MERLFVLVSISTIAVVVAAWLLWRQSRRKANNHDTRDADSADDLRQFPPEGLLVAEEVLRSAGSTADSIWKELETAASPIAVEYYPLSDAEAASFRTVPVNATAQQAMGDLVKLINPKRTTLLRPVLPKGAELVKAVGADGFRGFSRTGGKTTHAILKPVAVGGAITAAWPVFAVAATVTAVDMLGQRDLRAHQRRVETILGRQEERHYGNRVTQQKSADSQLTRAISLLLDGQNPRLELARKSADDAFFAAQQFLEKHQGVTENLVEEDGKVDYRSFRAALGGTERDLDSFIGDLHLARAAIAIQRKAITADAASRALSDPGNPYTALRKFMEMQVRQLEDTEAIESELTRSLISMELKGSWYDGVRGRWVGSDKSIASRQSLLRSRVSPPEGDEGNDVRYLVTSSGEIRQVLKPGEPEDEV